MPTGGEVVVQILKANGIRLAYGIPAVHNLPIYDGLYGSKDIRNILVKHEQAAGFMAIGSAYSSGEPAVSLVGCGPGATNMVTSVSEAYLDSIPMMVIAGGVSTALLGKGALHDIDQVSVFKPITKWCDHVSDGDEIASKVMQAISACRSGRPRPTFLEIPFNILASRIDAPETHSIPQQREERAVDKTIMSKVTQALVSAQRPLIIAGGGVNAAQSWNELAEVAETLQAPVASTISAKGAYPEHLPLSIGQLWDQVAQRAVGESDLVLALGCRFSERSTAGWRLRVPKRLIHVDIDPIELGRNYPAEIGVNADVKMFLSSLLRQLPHQDGSDRNRWIDNLQEAKKNRDLEYESYIESQDVPMKPQHVISELKDALPDDAILVAETGYAFWWSARMLTVKKPRGFLTPSGNSALGFGFPAALGTKIAKPDAPVIALVGDGGFLFSCQELATATEQGIHVVVVIFDDAGYAAIREFQRRGYGGRLIDVNFNLRTNFVKLAETFGAKGILVENPSQIQPAIKEALKTSGTTVIDVPIGREAEVLPKFLTETYKRA